MLWSKNNTNPKRCLISVFTLYFQVSSCK